MVSDDAGIIPVAKIEHGCYGVGVKAQLVVGDAAPSDELLALRESAAALVGIGDGRGEPAENIWAVEPDPRLTTDGQGFLDQIEASWRRPSASAALPRWSRELCRDRRAPSRRTMARVSSALLPQASKAPSIEEAKIAARRALSSAR